jgi:hypothetical protein
MPDSGVPGGGAPSSGGGSDFDPASLAGANANTTPEGTQSDMTGRMLNSAMLVAAANPELDDEACATLAVLAGRRLAANPLGYGHRPSVEGPLTQRVKNRVNELVSGEYQRRHQPRPQGRPSGQPGAGKGVRPTPRPAPSVGEQLLNLVPLKPHERRLVDGIRGLIKKHRDRAGNPPPPHHNAPPVPAPPWLDEDDQEDVDRPDEQPRPAAPGVLPPGASPHDLNGDDEGSSEGESSGSKAAVRHQADNPLDFGNRAPVPEGPLEQKAVDSINEAEDAVPMPGDTSKVPGMGGGKGSGGKAPEGAGAGAGEAAGGEAALGEVGELAPMIAV